jgi:hypothetical protein
MRDGDSAGKLAPLADDLPPELRELAEFLRRRYYALRTTVRAYALRNNWDPGAVSRFLSGERIPPQYFADTLLADAGPQRSPEEVEREHKQALDLRIKALQLRNARAAKAEQIAQQLAAAEQEISLLKAKEEALATALVKAKADHKSLYDKYQEMYERIQHEPLQITAGSTLKQLADERDRARMEIDRLNNEIADERTARVAAEARRDELQAELSRIDVALVRAGGSALSVGTYDSERNLLVALRGRATRWGGAVSLVAVPVVIYGAPIYLGLIYHILTASQEPLKVMTGCGLLIPLWFTLAIRRINRPESRRKVWRVAFGQLVITAILFFLAALILPVNVTSAWTRSHAAARVRFAWI